MYLHTSDGDDDCSILRVTPQDDLPSRGHRRAKDLTEWQKMAGASDSYSNIIERIIERINRTATAEEQRHESLDGTSADLPLLRTVVTERLNHAHDQRRAGDERVRPDLGHRAHLGAVLSDELLSFVEKTLEHRFSDV